MIKFFRRIRQNLLSECKTGKYLQYAIGEIILVVIGILIALQINNWNEERKIKQKETIVLKELLTSISSDLTAYKIHTDPSLERKANGIDSLSAYIFGKRQIKNSNFNNFYTNMSQDVFLRFDDGPFEDLKSSGLDIIRNDSLRTVINNTYTVKLPLFQHLANRLNDESKPEISRLEPKFLKLIPVLHDDGREHLHFDVKIDDILNNQDFLLILYIQQKKYDEYAFQLKEIRTTLNQLKSDIEKELEK
jgi:hypothetical protein